MKLIERALVNVLNEPTVSYDAHADVLYVSFGSDKYADGGTEKSIQVLTRFRGSVLVGLTVVDAKHQLEGGDL